jgi:predicted aconitase
MSLTLTASDERALDGLRGEPVRLAMRLVVAMGGAVGAERLLDVTSAHVDGGLYHGQVSLDFAERLAAGGARVAVPTTLNVGSLDLLHPDRYRGDPDIAAPARRLMDLYTAMGCRPSWTCAPYQLSDRPEFGDQVAWAESNAVAFANSVLGARTERYGDFLDICAAITGRVPDAGLHRLENRRGRILFRLMGVPARLLSESVVYPLVGHVVGRAAGSSVPVIEGLPSSATEDDLKALGAAAASSGSVGLFHAAGLTPEAPTIEDACQGHPPERIIDVTLADLIRARDSLSTAAPDGLRAVSLGTPHFSVAEFERLRDLVRGQTIDPGIEFWVSTGRDVMAQAAARGLVEPLERAGVKVVTDTCTYVTTILRPGRGVVMTDSAKWAYYAPGNIGAEVIFGSMPECVRSAVTGRVWRDPELWADA